METQRYKTKQEKLILTFFQNNRGANYTADDVYNKVCNEGVSRATVYRRLERLALDGIITKIKLGSGASYRLCDSSCDNSSHFVCTACNCVEHIECHMLPEISEHFEKGHGVRIDSAKTVFYGLCERCVLNEK